MQFLDSYGCKVIREFSKENPNEIALREGEVVFVKSLPVNHWVFVESLDGEEGYAPYFCLNLIQYPQSLETVDPLDPSYYLPRPPTNSEAVSSFNSPLGSLSLEWVSSRLLTI